MRRSCGARISTPGQGPTSAERAQGRAVADASGGWSGGWKYIDNYLGLYYNKVKMLLSSTVFARLLNKLPEELQDGSEQAKDPRAHEDPMRRELQPLRQRTGRRPVAPVQVHQLRCGRREEDPDVRNEVLQDERPGFRRLYQHVVFVCVRTSARNAAQPGLFFVIEAVDGVSAEVFRHSS